ncbi:MAG: NUDIX hydrolase [Candidatus Aenigmarchaeota archaeon]|nr:NUDIX hydrolase [Candidatus Aenigmarchaeota archaeon]
MNTKTRLAIDALIVTQDKKVVLVRRRFFPFIGSYAIPGGFIEFGEAVEKTCVREAFEETGLKVKIVKLLGVYSKMGRDPRGHTVSIIYLCKPVGGSIIESSDETYDVKAFSRSELRKLKFAFDHKKILKDAGLL